nr:hypothetical protein [Candidatus Levybacteria bacterium]
MKELFKNKKLVLAVGIVVLLVIFLGFLLLSNKSLTTQNTQDTTALPTQIPVPTITADSLGLTLKQDAAGKNAIIEISNPQGISDIEATLSYSATVNGEDVDRGALVKIDPTKKPVTKTVPFGTCSDVCHYDTGVKNVKIILKITKTDGKVYQAEQVLSSLE